MKKPLRKHISLICLIIHSDTKFSFSIFASNQLLSLMHKLVKDVGDDEWGECQVLLSYLLP